MRAIHLLLLMPAIATFSACGQGASTAAADVGAAPHGDVAASAAKPVARDPNAPLSADDITLYLTVMRAAAARVQHPPTADVAALQRARADTAAQQKSNAANQAAMAKVNAAMQASQAAFQRGDLDAARAATAGVGNISAQIKAPAVDEQADDFERAYQGGTLDSVIVQERHIDSDRYDSIVGCVEDAIPSPYTAVGSGGGDVTMTAEQRRQAVAYEAALAHWRQQLAPHRSEIQALEKIVREPHYGDR
ncbi:MAG: hypothetical protein ACRETW_01735 [Stenotrophobium sp.]